MFLSLLILIAKSKVYIIGGLADTSYNFGPITYEIAEMTKVKSA